MSIDYLYRLSGCLIVSLLGLFQNVARLHALHISVAMFMLDIMGWAKGKKEKKYVIETHGES